ncbi:MAG TPA: hypothetical protein VF713_22560 [Thermoanaerobaculia bacterium]
MKPGVEQHLHGQLAAFVHFPILGSDGGLANPGLQALYGFIMALLDLGPDRGEISPFGLREMRESECGGSGSGPYNKVSSVHAVEGNVNARCLSTEIGPPDIGIRPETMCQ